MDSRAIYRNHIMVPTKLGLLLEIHVSCVPQQDIMDSRAIDRDHSMVSTKFGISTTPPFILGLLTGG